MKRSLFILAAVWATFVSAREAGQSVETYKRTYESELAKIEEAHGTGVEALLVAYGKAIEEVVAVSQAEGDLETLLKAREERERFQREKSVPVESPAVLPAAIRNTQRRFRETFRRIETVRNDKTKALSVKYLAALDRRIRELTREGKMEEAISARDEKRRAEFVLADTESRIPERRPPPAPPKASVQKPPPAHQPGQELVLDLGVGDDVKMVFVWIPPGCFRMGTPDGEEGRGSDESPLHDVTLSKGFWMGKYEVTQEQYRQVAGETPSQFQGDKNPVEQVDWNDAQAFCRRVRQKALGSLKLKRLTCRLPTEAEWEYACRAGTTGRYYTGDAERDLAKAAWYAKNSGRKTHPAGQKKANAWGLHDMHGNVWEWCQDWLGDYPSGSATDPEGPASGLYRVIRGGGWANGSYTCRAGDRSRDPPDRSSVHIGFRVVLSRGR